MIINLDADLSGKLEDTIDKAIRFFGSKLLPESLLDKLVIDVEFDNSISEFALLMPEITYRGFNEPYHYKLTLKNKRINLIETLAHEMVHIKQFVLGELQYCTIVSCADINEDNQDFNIETLSVWMGEDWLPEHDDDPQFDAPWEIEAYGRENGLISKWNRWIKENK